jgi:hypothetical protein
VANRGDGEVFISQFLLTMPPGVNGAWVWPRLVFNEKLPVGQFLTKKFPAPHIQEHGSIARGLAQTDFEKLMTRAANGDTCLELFFLKFPTALFVTSRMRLDRGRTLPRVLGVES